MRLSACPLVHDLDSIRFDSLFKSWFSFIFDEDREIPSTSKRPAFLFLHHPMIANFIKKRKPKNQPPFMSLPSSSSSSSTSLRKRRPLLQHSGNSSNFSCCSGRFAEVAGGTTAECAAICCCCPCGLVNLLILTIYKVPAGLCRRALRRKQRQKLIKKGLLPLRTRRCKCGFDDTELQIHPMACVEDLSLEIDKVKDESSVREMEAMMKLEKEMWETFYGTGFWRSPSQRELPIRKSNASPKEKS